MKHFIELVLAIHTLSTKPKCHIGMKWKLTVTNINPDYFLYRSQNGIFFTVTWQPPLLQVSLTCLNVNGCFLPHSFASSF